MMRHFLVLSAALVFAGAPAQVGAQAPRDNNALVASWYQTYLGRAPDPGAAGWVTQLNQGVPADQILADILASDEFYGRAGSTPQGFVTLVYNDVVGRAPNPGELNYWAGRFYTTDRPAIVEGILGRYPGVWVKPAAVAVPPPVPGVVVHPPNWERDRHQDWAHFHDIHEYHRPAVPVHRDVHLEHRR